MSMKSAFVYALSLSLGIAAVTHAKTVLIERAPVEAAETQELVHRNNPALMDCFGLSAIV